MVATQNAIIPGKDLEHRLEQTRPHFPLTLGTGAPKGSYMTLGLIDQKETYHTGAQITVSLHHPSIRMRQQITGENTCSGEHSVYVQPNLHVYNLELMTPDDALVDVLRTQGLDCTAQRYEYRGGSAFVCHLQFNGYTQ